MDYKTSPNHENARRVISSLESLGIELDFIDNFPTIGAFFTDTTPLGSKAYYGIAMGDDLTDIVFSVNDVPGVRDLASDDQMRFMNDFSQIKSDDFVCSGTLMLSDEHPELRFYIDHHDEELQANIGEYVDRVRSYVAKVEAVAKGNEPFRTLVLKGEAPASVSSSVDAPEDESSAASSDKPKKKGLFGKLFS